MKYEIIIVEKLLQEKCNLNGTAVILPVVFDLLPFAISISMAFNTATATTSPAGVKPEQAIETLYELSADSLAKAHSLAALNQAAWQSLASAPHADRLL